MLVVVALDRVKVPQQAVRLVVWVRSAQRGGSPPTSRMNSVYRRHPVRFLASVVAGAHARMPCCAASAYAGSAVGS